uniref:Uncharacterized protein n=1 Tax=Amphimedon queenslandica TaxID=400682 RepID=A0A1X7VEZ3_AMPQE
MIGLHGRQFQLEVPQHHLVQDISTRWNSSYFILERLAQQKVATYAVFHDPAIIKPGHCHLDLNDTQWDFLSQIVVVLKPFQIATTVNSNVSCSIIYPVINNECLS